jgi:SAM-dependent MidA family methyltransferase
VNKLDEIIVREMHPSGVIPFSRFMELALYCPDYGYYEKEEDSIGRRGDFYTSVSVGPLFGQLLAFQFADWITEAWGSGAAETPGGPRASAGTLMQRDRGARLLEAGAHRGELARDILSWTKRYRPELFERLQYWILEPSARRREWQKQTLAEFLPQVRWATGLESTEIATLQSDASCPNIVFSNELMDAMPSDRFGWNAQKQAWFEWGVTMADGRFTWARLDTGLARRVPDFPADVLGRLPDGFTLETSPAAEDWWTKAARTVACGKLLTIDYGSEEPEMLTSGKTAGTLRAYRRHHLAADPLERPGDQDLTTSVNFTRLRCAGEATGLKTELLATQEHFLTRICDRVWKEGSGFGKWSPKHTRAFQTLTHPEHLGWAFRVLVQST